MTLLKPSSSRDSLAKFSRKSLPSLWICLLLALITQPALAASGPPQQTMLVLGDSLSAGFGVPQGKEWVQLLANRLDKEGNPIRVVNASISGDTSAGGLSRLQPLLDSHKPSWVLIELGANDGLRGLSPEFMEQNLQSIINKVRESGAEAILIGILIPPNYGRKYTERFSQVYRSLAKANKIPLLPFLLEGVAGNDAYMQADRLHPNTNGQPVIESHVWQFLEPILSNKNLD